MQMSYQTVIGLVLLGIFLVLIIPVLGVMNSSTNEQLEKQLCKASIGVKLKTGGVVSPLDLFCPRTFVIIKEDEMVRTHYEYLEEVGDRGDYSYIAPEWSGESVRRQPRSRPPSEGAINEELPRILAYEMAECWSTFLEGRRNILSSDTWLAPDNTCVICAEVALDRPDAQEGTINLTDYLRRTPTHLATETVSTYESYLYDMREPSQSEACKQHFYDAQALPVDAHQSYIVAFYRHSSAATRAAGATCQGVGVVPVQDLPGSCQAVVN